MASTQDNLKQFKYNTYIKCKNITIHYSRGLKVDEWNRKVIG